jgi:hypothetical protein
MGEKEPTHPPAKFETPDPKIVIAGVKYGGHVYKRGLTDFAAWSNEMIAKVGEKIRPYLPAVWNQVDAMYGEEPEEPAPPQTQARNGKAFPQATISPVRDKLEPRIVEVKTIMNKKQKTVLVLGIVLIAIAGLCPPWRFVLHGPYGISGSRSAGHSISAPSYTDHYQHVQGDDFYNSRPAWIETEIDVQSLAVEWATLTIIVITLLLVFKSSPYGIKQENKR